MIANCIHLFDTCFGSKGAKRLEALDEFLGVRRLGLEIGGREELAIIGMGLGKRL